MDLHVGGLALKASQGRECGNAKRLLWAPPASSTAPMLAAWPMQIVLTSGLMNCIVS
jgi:hypothetical protein